MRNVFRPLLMCLAIFSVSAQAALIDLKPRSNVVAQGEQFELAVQMGGLATASAPSLGAYDLDIFYDASRLQLNTVLWGDAVLGEQLNLQAFGSLQEASEISEGHLNVFEISFDDASWLEQFQAGNFALFRLLFTARDSGSAVVSGSVNTLSDAFGNSLQAPLITPQEINIGTVAALPEPASFFLIMAGLVSVACLRRYKAQTY